MFTGPHIERSDHGVAAVIRPVGEFDVASADLLRAVFQESITPTSSKLILDLAATTFLDSTALGAIIAAGKRASGLGGWVRLVAPPTNIRKVLRVTSMDTVFGLYDTVEQAVEHELDIVPAPTAALPDEPAATA